MFTSHCLLFRPVQDPSPVNGATHSENGPSHLHRPSPETPSWVCPKSVSWMILDSLKSTTHQTTEALTLALCTCLLQGSQVSITSGLGALTPAVSPVTPQLLKGKESMLHTPPIPSVQNRLLCTGCTLSSSEVNSFPLIPN